MKLAATTLAIVMVTLTACASGEASQTDSTSTEFDSAQTSLESAVLPVINEQMEEMGIPGLVAIVASPDRGTYKVAAGVANIDTNEPMKVENHFRIGSISKTLTATVVLQLAQEGKLGLDDALAPYFPTLDTNGATIRQALNMTSGIPTYTPDQFLNDLANNPARVWSPEELLATTVGQPAEFTPGAGWDYSNTNYVMLGLIAEQHGRASLDALVQDRIFSPLQMTGCSMPAQEDSTLPAPYSRSYQYGTEWDNPSPPAPKPDLIDVTNSNPSWGFGAGEAICTADDMAIWGRALVAGDLLDPEMQEERLDFVTGGAMPYGLGIAKLNGLTGHQGHMSGYQTQTTRRESDGTIIVVLTNITQAPDGELPATKISELISRAIPLQDK